MITPTETADVPCPRCSDEHFSGCAACGGTHAVTPTHATRLILGNDLRNGRLKRNQTASQEAEALGIPLTEYGDREHGRSTQWPTDDMIDAFLNSNDLVRQEGR